LIFSKYETSSLYIW